ncbi:hypothetical protein G6F43_012253 [Rhizopus delemar]|nr:hypothetical protein G6F43_012253 [Rhizopus delemar]
MRYAVEPLRAKGIRLIYYLDDICILERSKDKMVETVQIVLQHLENLGSLINKVKSVLIPSKTQEFLGFKINTRSMQISLPQAKIIKMMQRFKQLDRNPSRSCRWIAGLLGKITAVIPAMAEALLHIRHIQRDLARSLRQHNHQWDQLCVLSKKALMEINWWKENLCQKNGLPIRHPTLFPKALIVYVDASDSGWGVSSDLMSTSGFWSEEDKKHSINVRELTAIYYAILLHTREGKVREMLIHTDNITALKYVSKAGGTSSPVLQDLAVKIQDLCNKTGVNIRYQHIAGVNNTKADKLSRVKRPLYESTIPTRFFQQVKKQWGRYWKVDAFAAAHNRRLPTYWSLSRDPFAEEVNAFQQTWTRKDLYMFPPWRMIPQPILVPNVTPDETPESSEDLENPPVESSRMALINNKRKAMGMSPSVIKELSASTRPSTARIYDTAWVKYEEWCVHHKRDPTAYDTQQILEFLTNYTQFQVSTLNGYRSALASVLSVLYPEACPLAEHPEIVTFFRAKRRKTVKIPRLTEIETWDIEILVNYINQSLVPTETLNLYMLQQKLALLLCLHTMLRPRSDIGRLQWRDVILKKHGEEVYGVAMHIRQPKEAQQKTIQLGWLPKEKKEMCVLRCLCRFLQETQEIRANLPMDHTLLLTYLQESSERPPTSIAPATVAAWVRHHMDAAGLPQDYSPHSIRAAASTKAVQQGVSIDQVKQHANWSQTSTTSETEAEATRIVVGTTYNPTVAEAEVEEVVQTQPCVARRACTTSSTSASATVGFTN